MPRNRTCTSDGYVEIQWSRGGLVCIVSGTYPTPGGPPVETMHQFTREDRGDLAQFVKALRRAKRQAHDEPLHRPPCVDGSVCGEPAHCP